MIANTTIYKAAAIANGKGEPTYSIGAVTASICSAILMNHRAIRPISHYVEEYTCCLSVLTVLGREGVVKSLEVVLSEEEHMHLQDTARNLRRVIAEAEQEQLYCQPTQTRRKQRSASHW
jgi:L-lactate dehydrogenase